MGIWVITSVGATYAIPPIAHRRDRSIWVAEKCRGGSSNPSPSIQQSGLTLLVLLADCNSMARRRPVSPLDAVYAD